MITIKPPDLPKPITLWKDADVRYMPLLETREAVQWLLANWEPKKPQYQGFIGKYPVNHNVQDYQVR